MEQEGEIMMCADKCPLKLYCLPRLNDPSIIGCTVPEYKAGQISRAGIVVWHRIREDKNDTGRGNSSRRRKG